ncbi:nucleotide sugar dehydrogenase [Streptomyces spiramenti]|uniref:Nucleotide sugar dehydrogenase n=1 Tax=Streptomyces spiramenti TaxID=2720606 RepID=A0ABX1ASS0_9ACTN|nr:nucleotide sugar dehydrogenase [Streptomyces spiramenti]NJP68488.1 nucleotide sugar dehydrogenase [Streptomyces spiramenti]
MPADLAILGLGHLGLPAAQAATAQSVVTVGFTSDPGEAAALRAGRPPVDGSLSAAELRRMLAVGFTATSDTAVLSRVRAALICEPAPLGPDRTLDLDGVRAAARALAPGLRPHSLVVLETPVYPGTTEEVVRPLLEEGSGLRAGRDFHLAYSPSRVDPSRAETPRGDAGRRDPGAAPRVIGGLTAACTEAAVAFYGRLAEKVVRARGPKEAETVKVLETNFRHVNTAFVNEMAVLCHDLGVDLWDVLRCAETNPAGFPVFRPGPGVGGHSVPVDPGCLPTARRIPGHPPRMVELAQEVNERMPRYVTQRVATLLNEHGKSLRGARVLLLGVTYQPDVADEEGAPAREIAARLRDLGAQLSFHDPYVAHWRPGGRPVPRADGLYEAAADADLTLLLQHHGVYDLHGLAAKAQLLLDTRGATPAGACHRL